MSEFTLQQVYTAYRRLKNHFYFDNSNLPMRMKIAEFEKELDFAPSPRGSKKKWSKNPKKEIEKLLQPLVNILNSLYGSMSDDGKIVLDFDANEEMKKLHDITCYPIPKELKNDDENDSSYHYITNKPSFDKIIVDKCNFMIDAPIFIHIISVLWIEIVGTKLYPHISKENYAYDLNVAEDELSKTYSIKDGIMLFKPYFIGYQKWRDNALDEAKRLLDTGHDVTLLSLDVKRYYYSVRLNISSITKEVCNLDDVNDDELRKVMFMNNLLQLIHCEYQSKIETYLDEECKSSAKNNEAQEYVLPVGLLSSGLLANYYLSKFDKQVVKSIAPSFYGRYVDDLIFVFSNREVEVKQMEASNPVDEFLKRYFCSTDVLVDIPATKSKEKAYAVNVTGKELDKTIKTQIDKEDYSALGNLRVQTKKVILEYFDHKGSHAAIDIFLRNLKKNRSEYRFLPDEETITEEFDNEAYQLLYDDSVNKIRSMKDFKEDKYGAAKYLAKQIYLSMLNDKDNEIEIKETKKKVTSQLLTFFSGKNAIYMYPLWERVATYFVLNHDEDSLLRFYARVHRTIEQVYWEETKSQELQKVLEKILQLAIAMPMALCPKKITAKFKEKADELRDVAIQIRCANMFRNNYVGLMGINLTDALYDEDADLTDDNVFNLKDLKLNEGLCWMSPKFIHFEMLNMLEVYGMVNGRKSNSDKKISGKNSKTSKNELWDNYVKYGSSWLSLLDGNCDKDNHEGHQVLVKDVSQCIEVNDSKYVDVHSEPDKDIAIVNKKIETNHFMNIVKYHKPLHTLSRKQELVKIINDTIEQGAEMLVMPELTVPFGWLPFLVERAKQSNIAIVTGLEYCLDASKNQIANYVATILPFRDRYVKSCFTNLREKNFYSPKEGLLLEAYRYQFNKENKTPVYDLFHWRKCYFSVFNCFELADITSRAKFKSKVDFIIAVEYNKDVHYFSDVVGSWARDIHCFIVQVNSSDYGDSKIIMPSKTEEKTLVHVKGGSNTVVLTGRLPITSLRDFQLASYGEQINDKRFKFTPPGFDHDSALKRHNNEVISLEE